MQDDGILSVKADPDALATGLMAALQGGYLLAQARSCVLPRWPRHSRWRWPTSKALPALRQPPSRRDGRFLAVRAPPSRAASPPPNAKPGADIRDYSIERSGKTIIDAANEACDGKWCKAGRPVKSSRPGIL